MPKTKFLRVARSGKTIDGREITKAQIDQMAANYDPKKYGARVNLEHFMSFFPNTEFKAYGDVIAVKADTDSDGERVLLAQIDATPDLVKLAADRQKVYWSIEIAPNFAGTGEAYLAGLAATDTPASLGTEMLTFAVKSDKAPADIKDRLFSTAVESDFEVEDQPKDPGPGLMDKVKQLLSGKARTDDSRFTQVEGAVTAVAEEVAGIKTAADAFAKSGDVQALTAKVDGLSAQLADLKTKLSTTSQSPQRPQASGVDANQTDC